MNALHLVLRCALTLVVSAATGSSPSLGAERTLMPSAIPVESRGDAIEKYLRGQSLSYIEGIWLEDNSVNEIAIIKAPQEFSEYCDYIAIITESQRSSWRPGEVKLLITESATSGLYNMTYISTSSKTHSKVWATISSNGILEIDLKSAMNARYVKIYPKSLPGEKPMPSAAAGGLVTGSGFMLTPTAVVTSHHVVRGAGSISVVIGPLRIPAKVLLQDERNDLVVLQLQPRDSTVAGMLSANTECLPVRADTPGAGERVFALGYPLTDIINAEIVITEGIISSAVGPNGDPGIVQTSAAVQPGNSGGPLVDQYGRVVGVIAASANSAAIYRETGSLPQNVNFAVSAAPLRAMVGFMPGAGCPQGIEESKSMTGQQVKARCAKAVVKVEAER